MWQCVAISEHITDFQENHRVKSNNSFFESQVWERMLLCSLSIFFLSKSEASVHSRPHQWDKSGTFSVQLSVHFVSLSPKFLSNVANLVSLSQIWHPWPNCLLMSFSCHGNRWKRSPFFSPNRPEVGEDYTSPQWHIYQALITGTKKRTFVVCLHG